MSPLGVRILVAADSPDRLDVESALSWIADRRSECTTAILVVPTFDQLRHGIFADLTGPEAAELALRERRLVVAVEDGATVEVEVATDATVQFQPLRLIESALALVWPPDSFVARVVEELPHVRLLVVPSTPAAEKRLVVDGRINPTKSDSRSTSRRRAQKEGSGSVGSGVRAAAAALVLARRILK